ncbi:Retrograde regulation protein 2 [Elsinoe australis]|uniref:Retrograde regulation protein 2 n=1 Tax=Elsinoe australis TaxID=40998 RepID=A0A2P7ZEA8_9PEZI|nr:Retrograde regulation protein 2 [Elsinoe australis]
MPSTSTINTAHSPANKPGSTPATEDKKPNAQDQQILSSPPFTSKKLTRPSNGIRLSLTSLAPPQTRTLPTLHQSRIPISLYDAQFPSGSSTRQPIPTSTIKLITTHLLRFRSLCDSYSVPEGNITVLATEATRTAPNAAELIEQIKDATGWDVLLLPKEEEGRVGAFGVVSSLGAVEGVVMDLGGGSTQLSLVGRGEGGQVVFGEKGAVSLPFGAAALMRRLGEEGEEVLGREVTGRVGEAVKELGLLEGLGRKQGGMTLYLSGGGFRGWGYLLMNAHEVQPYPVPIINGFRVGREKFVDAVGVQRLVQEATEETEDEEGKEKKKASGLFRISQRRASQVPAVAFLIKALADSIPEIKEVRFCQGGVREGYLFSSLPPDVQSQSPLVVATQPFARSDAQSLARMLNDSMPEGVVDRILTKEIIQAFANVLYFHGNQVKDSRTSSALRFTTTGELASTHGLSHEERSILSLLLCERWGGKKDLPGTDEDFYERLSKLADEGTRWWCRYLGKVAALYGAVWPAGYTYTKEADLRLTSHFDEAGKKRAKILVSVKVSSASGEPIKDFRIMYEDELEGVEKVGKKKHWIGGKEGFGHKVDVELEELHTE